MVFRKMMAGLGVGSASVATELDRTDVMPGGAAEGEIRVRGGRVDQHIEGLFVELRAVVEVETNDGERHVNQDFARVQVAGEFGVRAGAEHSLRFVLPVPWETPLTVFRGVPLRGTHIGVRTELAIDRAIDKGDLDPVHVHAVPAQALILDAFGNLGFHFKGADLEKGRISGTRQTLPFYQEIEFTPPPAYKRGINEVELSFVTDGHATDVVLEIDRKNGVFGGGGDTYRQFTVEHASAGGTDWTAFLHNWFQELGAKRGWL